MRETIRKYGSLYTVMGMVGVLAVLIGFAKTFIIPVSSGEFHAPAIIYIHGALAFLWVVLLLVQATLIKAENWKLHMNLGILGMLTAAAVAVTLPIAVHYQTQKEIAGSGGDTATSLMVGGFLAAILFLSLVMIGYVNRKKPETHKRLMLLATIALLWPAWFRFRHYFPGVPRPDIWFAVVLADSLIAISCIWDRIANGRVHRALFYGGLAIIMEHTFEVLAFDTPPWAALGKALYALF